ncbi:MAG: type II toxin-antitoxin system VapC family toxin [Solirubrobacteraceae bacterium]
MKFADTSFFVALLNRRDDRHEQASALWAAHADSGSLTTNHVVGETWTVLRRRAGHGSAVAFVDSLTTTDRIELLHVSSEAETQALDWLRRHDERAYSFVDATSFGVMRSKRIAQALAFDGDFSAAGFIELRR